MEHTVAAPQSRSGVARLFHPLVEARTYRETVHLLLDLVAGVFWFTVLTTLITGGVSLVETDHRRVLAVLRYLEAR